MKKTRKLVVTLPAAVVAELDYMIELGRDDSMAYSPKTVEDLIVHVVVAVADGSRRPGAWEREVISMLGLVSSKPEHHFYRSSYGDPADANATPER